MADKQMTDEEIAAVVEVAHGVGKKVAAHLGGNKPIQDAVRLGVDSIEHGYSMTDETCEMIAKNHKYFVPTLSVTNCDDYLLPMEALNIRCANSGIRQWSIWNRWAGQSRPV